MIGSKLKILIVRNYPNYIEVGPNATYNIQELGLASALVRKGHICDIVFWTNGEEHDVRYDVPGSSSTITIFYRRAFTVLKNAIYNLAPLFDQYDILQPAEYNQLESLFLAITRPNQTVVYHGQYFGEENRRYNTWCKYFDLFGIPLYKLKKTMFLTKSKMAAEYLAGKGINSSLVTAPGVGINSDVLDGSPTDKSELLGAHDRIRLLYVGGFMPRRHLELIGQIALRLKRMGTDCEIVAIGSAKDEYGLSVIDNYKKWGLADSFIHIPSLEQKALKSIYCNCDFFLFPSTYEIFGMVLLEAMHYGLPVISYPNGGSSMLIEDGVNGFVLNNLDPEAWANKIVDVLNDTDHRARLSANASNTVSSHFTWDALADSFIDQYNKRLSVK